MIFFLFFIITLKVILVNPKSAFYLSRITIYDSKNHRLKTLKEYLGLNYNSHRALDDSLTCNDLYQYCKNKKKRN